MTKLRHSGNTVYIVKLNKVPAFGTVVSQLNCTLVSSNNNRGADPGESGRSTARSVEIELATEVRAISFRDHYDARAREL